MALVFQGSYSRAQIKRRLDRAMTLYDTPRTTENYSRAASALIELRKEYGVTEMSILAFMVEMHVPGVNMNFGSAAGLAAGMMAIGDS
jgi:hypothetical protein